MLAPRALADEGGLVCGDRLAEEGAVGLLAEGRRGAEGEVVRARDEQRVELADCVEQHGSE